MKQFTNKLGFSLTLKRFVMMSKSTSFLRSFSLKLTVFPVLSIMFVAFCTEVYDGHPNAIYSNDITLTPVNGNESVRGYYWITWLDLEGIPYSGEQTWLYRINDQLASKKVYENGKEIRVEMYNQDGDLKFISLSEFSEDENGIRYLNHYQIIDSTERFLAFEAKWEQNIHTVKEYFMDGQLRYEFSFNTEINKYEGLAFLYDQEGNLLKRERYENGILIETIK